MKSFPRCLLLAALSPLLLAGCHEVPVTGRRALSAVSDKDVVRLSVESFEEMKRRYPVSRDRERVAQLNRIGDRLSRAVSIWDMPDANWEFIVFEVPNQINAFAMAGGKVGVFSGLFKIVENDDQLASVLAHEIAHVTAKHVHERLSQQMLANTGGMALGIGAIATGAGGLGTAAVMEAYGLGTGIQILSYDRKKEIEADRIGLHYMARAGYDPREAIKVIERLEQESAGKPMPPALLSTHPSNPQRMLQMIDEMPKALEAYEASGRKQEPVLVK